MPQPGIEQVLCQKFSGVFYIINSATYDTPRLALSQRYRADTANRR
jgi:hypothetical protein